MANGSLSHFFEKDMNNIVLSRISSNLLITCRIIAIFLVVSGKKCTFVT